MSGARPARARRSGQVALALAAAVVLVQVAVPLLDGGALAAATRGSVVLFALASVTSALATHGPRAAAALVLLAGGTGLAAEAVGVATGVPFGTYAYTGALGPQVAGVPLLVPLAWLMMAWPTLLAGRAAAAAVAARRARRRPAGRVDPAPPAASPAAALLPVLLAAWLLAAWDLYLDPQMVVAGYWAWASPEPSLPGVPGVPLTNYAGWLLVALVMQALLHAAVPRRALDGAQAGAALGAGAPALLLAWTWLGSGLANAAFFGRPAVGAWGLAAMGVVAAPALLAVLRATGRTSRGTGRVRSVEDGASGARADGAPAAADRG